jgi:3-isopropylmalate/(R)-2-methylmalate dehydratase large subunit
MKRRRKSPTKIELQQLQKLYKTDEKIGERLGGVPAYLVAYWRRKKGIPKYSLPKFSEQDVRNLWERYGDDEKAGLELGISKAAFYNWRRRYGLKEKPAFLKLEQLELNFPGAKQNGLTAALYGKRTMIQKILARAAELERVEIGQTVTIDPDVILPQGDIVSVFEQFRKQGPEYFKNANKVVATLTETTECGTIRSGSTQSVREFLKRQGVKNIHDSREGCCHQIAIEKGHALPGQIAVGIERSTLAFGAVGGGGIRIDSATMAAVLAHGKLSVPVPGSLRLAVGGHRPRGVSATDVAIHLFKRLGDEVCDGRVIELGGSLIGQMSLSERITLTELLSALDPAAVICPYDATTRRFLNGRSTGRYAPFMPDKDAEYENAYQVHVDHVTPMVICHCDIHQVKAAAELESTPVHHVIVGGCTSGRFEDLRIASEILRNKEVHVDCRLYVVPGSRTVYLEALKKGLIRLFVEAGAIVTHPGYLPPVALKANGEGEKVLATASSAFFDRTNSAAKNIYLCSPATAAASALNGVITDPSRFVK